MKKIEFAITMLVIFALALSGCSAIVNTAKSVVNEYHTLITAYQNAQKYASNFQLCVDTAMGTIYTQAVFLQNYQQADVEKAKVWREALDTSSARLAETLMNYKDADGIALGRLAGLGRSGSPECLARQRCRGVQLVRPGLPGGTAGAGE